MHKSLLLVLLPLHAAVLGQCPRRHSKGFGDMGWRTTQGSEATPAPESSNIQGEYKTCAEQLQNPALPTRTCIPLQFSNMKAGCANSVHNPDLALSNKHENLPEQAGADGPANKSFCQLPWSTSEHGQEPRFCNKQLPQPWLGLLLGWKWDEQFPTAFQLGKSY